MLFHVIQEVKEGKSRLAWAVQWGVRQNAAGAIKCRAGALALVLDSSFPSFPSVRFSFSQA
jgi:hypothetical protein